MTNEQKIRKEILRSFKGGKSKEKSTTEIAGIISRNYYVTIKILEGMKNDNLLEKIKLGKFTFWKTKQ